jgi:hypothetical protein
LAKQKFLLIISSLLAALCAYLLFQWNNERKQSEEMEHMREELITRSFNDLGSKLYHTAQTLRKYKSDFTEREKALFTQSLAKDSLSLNHIGIELGNYLRPAIEGNTLVYEQHIWVVEDFLNEILQGNVTDEHIIHSIAEVMYKQSSKLSDMFYKEEYIGTGGLDSGEIQRIIERIEMINDEIRKHRLS